MAGKPRISVLTPTLNNAPFLKQCIESVLAQGDIPFEHIVMDGLSTDGSQEILAAYPHLRWTSEKDTGEANALNKAAAQANGEVLLWLNGDDWLEADAFHHALEVIAPEKGRHVAYGAARFVDDAGHELGIKRPLPRMPLGLLLRWWLHFVQPHQPSMFFSQELLQRTGPFREDLHFSIDLEFWIQAALHSPLHHVNHVLSNARLRTGAKSSNTESHQIESHWNVVRPVLARMEAQDVIAYWADYFLFCWASKRTPEPWILEDPLAREGVSIATVRLGSSQPLNDVWPGSGEGGLGLHLQHVFKPICLDAEPIEKPLIVQESTAKPPRIVLDGIFFQFNNTGIARLWASTLAEWAADGFAGNLVVLDRGGTLPTLPGIRTRRIHPFRYEAMDQEPAILEAICREERADVFLSTYYTVPMQTPSVFLAYDMIPEVMGMDLRDPAWVTKHVAIRHASAFAAISSSTARDLNRFFPSVPLERIAITACGVSPAFRPPSAQEVGDFRRRMGLTKPYFLFIGYRHGYKNGALLFQALSRMPERDAFEILCSGGAPTLEPEFADLAKGTKVHLHRLSDEDLRIAYGGATALVHPSLYEGFGLPVLEAMASGCPVIASNTSSIPEVGGDACRMITGNDVDELVQALREISKPEVRQRFVDAGFARVAQFTWKRSADALKRVILETIGNPMNIPISEPITSADSWIQAQEALKRDDAETAQTLLLSLLNSDPHFIPAYLSLADLLEHHGDPATARQVLEAGLDQNPQTESLWAHLIALSARQEPQRAASDAWDAIRALPHGGQPLWYELVCQTLLNGGHEEDAHTLLDRGLKRFPDHPGLSKLSTKRTHGQEARTTVFCAVWHKDPHRWELLKGHQACLDAQSVPVERIYVFDGNDEVPDWVQGKVVVSREPLDLYEAWNVALPFVRTPYVANLNLDDRLNPDAIGLMENVLDGGADLVGGDWKICFTQADTDAIAPSQESRTIAFHPEWPPVPGRTVRLGSGTGERGTLGPSCLWRMSLHREFPRYPSRFGDGKPIRSIADSIWWRLLMERQKIVKRLPMLIGRYFSHPEEQAEFRNPSSGEEEHFKTVGISLI